MLQQKLQATHAAITEVERRLLKTPDSLMLRLELESLVDIRDALQADPKTPQFERSPRRA